MSMKHFFKVSLLAVFVVFVSGCMATLEPAGDTAPVASALDDLEASSVAMQAGEIPVATGEDAPVMFAQMPRMQELVANILKERAESRPGEASGTARVIYKTYDDDENVIRKDEYVEFCFEISMPPCGDSDSNLYLSTLSISPLNQNSTYSSFLITFSSSS